MGGGGGAARIEALRAVVMPSDREAHAIGAHQYPSPVNRRALGRPLQKHRIGVVHMGIDLSWPLEARQPGQGSIQARDRMMIHLPRTPVTDSERDQLVVG